jgi:hypothetical protein
MRGATDHDGKSKTASAADRRSYPDPIAASEKTPAPKSPTPAPDKSVKPTEAEHEKQATDTSKSLLDQVDKQSGSVQR